MNVPLRLLYTEDNPIDADQTRSHFASHAPEIAMTVVDTGQKCLDRLRDERFDLLLLDNHLPDMDGLEVLKSLNESSIQVPTVLVTGAGDESLVLKAMRLGAASYVPKSGNYLDDLPTLLRGVVAGHREKDSEEPRRPLMQKRILYVDDSPMDIDLALRHFARSAPHFTIDVADCGASALTRLRQSPAYDLALIDLRLPDIDGLALVREAERNGIALPPFVMLSGHGNDGAAIAAMQQGAAEYVVKKEGYLVELTHIIDHVVDYDRLKRITEQLREELAARRRAENSLRQSEANLASAQAVAHLGSWELDLATERGTWSAEMYRLFGWNPTLGPPSFAEFLDLVDPADREAILTARDKVVRTREVETFEFRSNPANRPVRTFSATVAPTRIEAEHVDSLTGTVLDITRQRQVEAQLRQAQKMESLGNLAGGIAHDFNNLLLPIVGLTELAQDELPADSPARENLSAVIAAAWSASALADQILAFSRKNDGYAAPIDISACVEQSLNLLRNVLPATIKLVDRVNRDVGVVFCDPAQLQSVILNLGSNATDALDGKIGDLTIGVERIVAGAELAARKRLTEGQAFAKLSIRDTGCGMDQATIERIFDPFYTTKAVGKGTGLGLATVHGFVESLKGAIEVTSEVGVGTTFDIYLPLQAVESESEIEPRKSSPARGRVRTGATARTA